MWWRAIGEGVDTSIAESGWNGQRVLVGAGWMLWRLVSRIAPIVVMLTAYSWFRKTYFQQPASEGFANALDLIHLQERLRLDMELTLQRWVLDHRWAVDFFNGYYRNFKPALYVCMATALILAPERFGKIARMFVLATIIAVPWYAWYPLAPPRFMEPYGYPFVDTLAVFSPSPSTTGGLGGANQYAAMPSMHIGWTTIAVLWLVVALPWKRIGLVLGVLHVLLMSITVMVTGNHYFLDIVAGFAVAGAAALLEWLVPWSGIWRAGQRAIRP